MKNLNCQFSGKLYAVKRQYPALVQFEKHMCTVKRELNRDLTKRDRGRK